MLTLYSVVNETRNRNRILEMCKFQFRLVHWIDLHLIEHSYAWFDFAFWIMLWCLLYFVWAIAEAKCRLVAAFSVSVCLSVHHHIPTLMHGPGCKLREWYEVPCSCAVLSGFAIGARFCCYDNVVLNARCQWVLVLALWLFFFKLCNNLSQ